MNYITKAELGQGDCSQPPEQPLELLAIGQFQICNQLVFGGLECVHACLIADASFVRNFSANGPAVGGVRHTTDELVSLEPVHQLCDVRFYTGDALGELAQRKRLVSLGQVA